MALWWARPLVESIIDGGRWLSIVGQENLLPAGVIGVLLGGGWAIWRARNGDRLSATLATSGGIAMAAQALVVADHVAASMLLFVGSFALAAWGGRLATTATDADTPGGEPRAGGMCAARMDAIAIAGLCLLTMVVELNALNQHGQYFFHEQIPHFLQAMSLRGVKQYMIDGGFYGNAPGAVHIVVMWFLGRFLGGSILTVRATAVLGAVITVPVFYLFVRRYFGQIAALAATTLMATSPTNIWFGRTDDNFFIYVPLLAIALAWSTRRALESGGLWRWLVVVLLMGGSRFVYAAGQLGWMLPVGLVCHALIFGRPAGLPGDRESDTDDSRLVVSRPWAGLAAVVAGVLLWTFSITLVLGSLRGNFEWISPLMTHGVAAWDGTQADASLIDRAVLTTGVMAHNLARLAMGLFWNTSYGELFWYRWSLLTHRSVWLVSAVAALLVPALGLLGARYRRSRPAMLLIWMAVAIVPGCLSSGLGVRRVLMLFPAAYAAVGHYLQVLLESSARGSAIWMRRLAGGVVAALVLMCSVAGLNAGLRAPTNTPAMLRQARMLEPILRRNDLVIHALDPRHESTIVFFDHHLFEDPDHLIAIQYEPRERWPDAVLKPTFRGDSGFYRYLGFEEEARRLAHSLRPRSLAIIVHDVPENQPSKHLLQNLFPEGVTTSCCSDQPGAGMWVIEVEREQLDEVARPEGRSNDPGAEDLFARAVPGIPVNCRLVTDATIPILKGGLRAQDSGWHAFDWNPECGTRVTVDGRLVDRGVPIPLVEGVHGFTATLADGRGCETGLGLLWSRFPEAGFHGVTARDLWGPRVAEVDSERLEPITPFAGYGERCRFVEHLAGVWDMDGGPDGGLTVLCVNLGAWTVHVFDGEGTETASWRVPIGPQPHGMRVARTPSGEVAVVGSDDLFLFTPAGQPVLIPDGLGRGLFTDVVASPDGTLWMSHFDRRAILSLTPDRTTIAAHELDRVGGNEGLRPTGLALDPEGRLVVLYENGLIQLIAADVEGDLTAPARSFVLGYRRRPESVRLAIPTSGWIHATFRPPAGWLSYDVQGNRRMAAEPERSLFGAEISQGCGITAVGEDLFVFDDESGAIWRMRPSE